ncbi:response regulator transcription factor [Jeotgalicoccus huakuii]|uniref:response regulator transcription factor n=1 Tax=Jeotgalicoccus TaxID=227979 RepID=UPI00041B903A|nr:MULTISPECIES: response regulator transcription factor [Jeotgalicoccus]MCK1976471.1 response regulator transcription factor [Jeotgalicoccus huakuii]QQD84359.1 response regulator transcription factor [Jeotgalicoccus sp. ATCC 8456]
MNKILVVDDDPNIVKFVTLNLEEAGFLTVGASDGRNALEKLKKEACDLAVVDIMMPYMDGLALTEILKRDFDIPIIMLTAKGHIDDKAEAFKIGTDDYLVKPFEPRELLFRIEALLRRYSDETSNTTLKLGKVLINSNNYSVEIEGKVYMLPLKEFELLQLLAQYPGQVFTRDALIERIWGPDYEGDDRTVDVHIKRLRSRFKSAVDEFEIKTMRGRGYFLERKI